MDGHWLARQVAETGFAQRAVADRADLSIFRGRVSMRLVLGLFIFVLNFVMGWPVVALLAAVAVRVGDPDIILIGGPAAYLFSWGLLGLGIFLAGPDSARYLRVVLRWAVRRLVERRFSRPGE